jgi:F0F1-type ATP synthase delta subunit
MEKHYAAALERLIAGGMTEEVAFDKLIAHLRGSGRLKILPQLLRELRMRQERNQVSEALLEVATAAEAASAEAAAKKEGITAKAIVNPDLISGWRARSGGTLIDRSGKRALVDLYHRIAG